jgi:hypothetical protein
VKLSRIFIAGKERVKTCVVKQFYPAQMLKSVKVPGFLFEKKPPFDFR